MGVDQKFIRIDGDDPMIVSVFVEQTVDPINAEIGAFIAGLCVPD